MVLVQEKELDFLRFLWPRDVNGLWRYVPEVINLRFTRVVFRINSSPFMLNAMIDCHKQIYQEINPLFVDEFLSSIYVVDVSIGSDNAESTYELYLNSKSRLAEAGFKLRKFVTYSE